MKMDIQEVETADYDVLENIKTAFYRLWKMKMVVILFTLIGLLSSLLYIYVVGIHTNYYAQASIFSAVYGSYEDSTDGVKVMNTYSDMLESSRVAERAAANLQSYGITATMLKNMVMSHQIYLTGASSDSKKYGYKLILVASASSPDYVVDIANAMAKAFADEINDLLGTSSLQVFDSASSITSVKSINAKLYFILFGAIAFIGSAAVIFIKEFFSTRVYSATQCEQNKQMILGLLPYSQKQV